MRIPSWLWPTQLNPASTPLVRIGRVIHWLSLLAALFLLLAALGILLVAAIGSAAAQEGREFNAASPAMQQVIRDQRALQAELKNQSRPNPFDQFDTPANYNDLPAGYTLDPEIELDSLSRTPPPKQGNTFSFEEATKPSATDTNTSQSLDYNQGMNRTLSPPSKELTDRDVGIIRDNSKTRLEVAGRLLILIAGAVLVAAVGRGLRYILSSE